jgi:hypothetical protein
LAAVLDFSLICHIVQQCTGITTIEVNYNLNIDYYTCDGVNVLAENVNTLKKMTDISKEDGVEVNA